MNNAWLKFMQVSEPEVWQLVDAMGAALSGTPKSEVRRRAESIAKALDLPQTEVKLA